MPYKDFPKRLIEVYDATNKGKGIGLFRKSTEESYDFKKELNDLEYLDYLEIVNSPALGSAYVRLTPNGIKFCEKILNGV